jgi:hypothetical protein
MTLPRLQKDGRVTRIEKLCRMERANHERPIQNGRLAYFLGEVCTTLVDTLT